jgi:hypothetical protein
MFISEADTQTPSQVVEKEAPVTPLQPRALRRKTNYVFPLDFLLSISFGSFSLFVGFFIY